jgi:hypothetical protein
VRAAKDMCEPGFVATGEVVESVGRLIDGLPVFAPTLSAGAAVAFASLLAAISLSVSIQVVYQDARRARNPQRSIWLAVMAFVSLVISAYTYVRLAGRPDQVSGVRERLREISACEPAAEAAGLLGEVERFVGEGQVAAGLFIVAGTLLAVGAVAMLGVLVLTILETSSDEGTRSLTVAAFDAAAFVTVVYLASGMWEITQIRSVEIGPNGLPYREAFSIGDLWVTWVAGACAAVVCFMIARSIGPIKREAVTSRKHHARSRWVFPRLWMCSYWIVPVGVGVLVDNSDDGFSSSIGWDIAVATIAFAAFLAAVGAVRGFASTVVGPEDDPTEDLDQRLRTLSASVATLTETLGRRPVAPTRWRYWFGRRIRGGG